MPKILSSGLALIFFFFVMLSGGKAQDSSSTPSADLNRSSEGSYAKEPYVFEEIDRKVKFEADGTGQRDVAWRVRIQSESAVREYGLIVYPFASGFESLEVLSVHVRKPDGTVVETPASDIQELDTAVSRQAPMYTDEREKQIAVKSLGVGDVLEVHLRWIVHDPMVPGHFWFDHSYFHSGICLRERIQVDVPANVPVKFRTSGPQPLISEEKDRRLYTFESSNLKKPEESKIPDWDKNFHGAPPPDVQISSFASWQDVGNWFGSLEQAKVKVTLEIRSKAEELINGKTSEDEKLRAIYDFVSTRFRYIGIDLGHGRYTPHAASEVLANRYGDCKDKHTLFAALLRAAGITAYPALISSQHRVDPSFPTVSLFNHVITAISRGDSFLFLDTTPEVAPYGLLVQNLRDRKVLVIPDSGPSLLESTSPDLPFPAVEQVRVDASIDSEGTLDAKVHLEERGDGEVALRLIYHSTPQNRWQELTQNLAAGMNLGGSVSQVSVAQPEDTSKPFWLDFSYRRTDYPDWKENRVTLPAPRFFFRTLNEEQKVSKDPLPLGGPADITYDLKMRFPQGFTPLVPKNVEQTTGFAEFTASYSMENDLLRGILHLKTFAREIPGTERGQFSSLATSVDETSRRYVAVHSNTSSDVHVASSSSAKTPEAGRLAAHPLTNKTNVTDTLAQQLLDKFADSDKKGVIVMDFQPSFGELSLFGPWLADQLSASLGQRGLEFIDRNKLQASLDSQHLVAKDKADLKTAVGLARSIGATTLVFSSYGAAENGIGVTLGAFRVSEYGKPDFTIGMVFGKIPLSKELSSHLGVQLDSLRPKDGVYRSGYGGVSVPACVKCPTPGMKVPDIDLQGMLRAHPQGANVLLQFVVTPEGHTQNIKVVQPVGYGFDEQYVKAAQGWELKPAIDADGRTVPVLYDFNISFNFKGAQESAQATGPTAADTDSKKAEASSKVVKIISDAPEANLIREADQAVKNRDYSTAAQLLEKLTATDPNYRNAWNYLGWTYNALGQYEKAEVALRKAIAVDPKNPQAYNNLGQALAFQKKYDEAIPQYQKQIEINPNDHWAHANLGRAYLLSKQYEKATAELETAATISPDDPSIAFNLGRAYAKTNELEKAAKALEKSVQLQPIPTRWNAVAYEMAVNRLDLPQAEKYAQSAIAATVLQMRDTSLEHLTREDTFQASRIASYWDTWGWIRFQENDLEEAEKYVRCAWMIHSLSVNADHLGQIYEKLGKRSDAVRMYQMAVASDPSETETRERLAALARPDANTDQMNEEGKRLLKGSRTITVKNSHEVEGFAEFWILLSPGPKVLGVKFVTGDEELAPFANDLQTVSYPNTFPEASELRLLRRGRLACSRSSTDCNLQMISSSNVQADELAATVPSVAGDVGRVRIEGNVTAAKLVKKVQPVYPLLAVQGRIQGVVKLHAIIGRDGTVKQLEVISGHPLLLQAALDAVRQWTYQPTLLEGKPVEVDTEIDVMFQLAEQKPQ